MNLRLKEMKEIPGEASLFFIGWIWLGWSMFGMTLVNMLGPNLHFYHFFVGAVYLFPASVIGFRIYKGRNASGIPLLICSVIVGVWALVIHLKMNMGFDYGFYSWQAEMAMMSLLLVAVPASFYFHARSIGCKGNGNLKAILAFAAVACFLLAVSRILGTSYYFMISSTVLFSYLFVIGPALGVIYVWEVMSREGATTDGT